MDKKEVIIFVAVMAFAALRLYQRYVKKDKNKPLSDNKPTSGSLFNSSNRDDDYEPYSKK